MVYCFGGIGEFKNKTRYPNPSLSPEIGIMDYSHQGIHSIDLTEDEESGETTSSPILCDKQNKNSSKRQISVNSPPPLTPIPRLENLRRLQNCDIPKLTEIRENNCTQQSSKAKIVKLVSSYVIKPPVDDASLEESKIIEGEVENQGSNINYTISHNPLGKILKIRKNKKVYEYIIPHNVLPLANQFSGPVLLNIPEVGSLAISVDPKAKNQLIVKNDQLEPFSLNFDEIRRDSDEVTKFPAVPSLKPVETATEQTRKRCSCFPNTKQGYYSRITVFSEDLLMDKSFCWQYSKTKRKEHRNLKNLLGFSKVELRNTKSCIRSLGFHLYQKHCQLVKKRELLRSLTEPSNVLGDEKSQSSSSNEPEEVNQHSNGFDDLLVTRKVVILDNENGELPESKQRHRRPKKFKQTEKVVKGCNENLIKPCYVKMTRCQPVDQMYEDLIKTKDPRNSDHPKKYKSHRRMFLSMLIDSKQKFRKEVAFVKPITMLNIYNFSIVKYGVESNKSNIVYAVNKDRHFPNVLLQNHNFVRAVQVGFVKLVDVDILCSYVKGEVDYKV